MELTPKLLTNLTTFVTDKPELLKLEDLVTLYHEFNKLKNFAEVLKQYILACLQAGEKIEGYKLVASKGRSGYSDPQEVVKRILAFTIQHPERKDLQGLIQPASIKDMKDTLSPEVVAELLGDLIVFNEGKSYDFAPITDSRDEVKL